ncbi:hypothetical protein DFO46_0124 [Rhizobium sp. AG855]|nr:hypothetical protein DFO46_0124 [Rhizobium sp. AG855]
MVTGFGREPQAVVNRVAYPLPGMPSLPVP